MNKYLSRYFFYYPATLLKGERIYPLLKQKRKNQWLSQEEIISIQIQYGKKIVEYAKKNSSFYQELYSNLEPESLGTIESFSYIPTITKKNIINQAKEMETNYPGSYETKTTGGSTGQPVKVLKNVGALAHERAATWRSYEWTGISIGESQGRFWGVPHTQKDRLKARIADLVANRKRVNAFNLTEDSLFQYYNDLKRFCPAYLYGYVSVIEALAQHILDRKLAPLQSLKSIITTSEVLYEHSRAQIEKAFNVKVFNEYGCGEVGSIAHECEYGSMHIMADNMIVETSSEGELIVTDLHNYKMPLIRYKIGDFGDISTRNCQCGRGLPILENIHGRAYDFIQLKDGKKIHPESIIYIFENFRVKNNVISQFQAVQTELSKIQLFIIPKNSWNEDHEQKLLRMMAETICDGIEFEIIKVKKIEREKSGKMRLVKSLLK